jgi:transcriptional regulator with XRE-family HTH domain
MTASEGIGARLKYIRVQAGLTLRQLGSKCGIAASYLSNLERGGSSPTLATLARILRALGSDLESFFANASASVAATTGPVFRRSNMRVATDSARRYTFLLPRRKDVKAEMLDEYLMPGESDPEMESLECDVAGVLLSGTLELDVPDEGRHILCPGDSFYVAAGKQHRGRCLGPDPAHLITVYVPPKY